MSDLTRCAPLVRCLRVARAIDGQRYIDIKALAESQGLHQRTIRRYLIALERAGWTVGLWRSNSTYGGEVVN